MLNNQLLNWLTYNPSPGHCRGFLRVAVSFTKADASTARVSVAMQLRPRRGQLKGTCPRNAGETWGKPMENLWETQGKPWKTYGKPRGNPRKAMETHGNPRGNPRKPMEFRSTKLGETPEAEPVGLSFAWTSLLRFS